MRRGLGDRRRRSRFEIVGDLGGTLETAVALLLCDVGRGGVLAESPVPLTPGALHDATFFCDGARTPARVCVRHVRPCTLSSGEQRFLAGLEFTHATPALMTLVEGWMRLYGEPVSNG